jgi:hypothetical protein
MKNNYPQCSTDCSRSGNYGHQISRRNLPLADLLENFKPLWVISPQESMQILQIIYKNGEKTRRAQIRQQTLISVQK